MSKYFYSKNGEVNGPFTLEELKGHAIQGNTQILQHGQTDWIAAGKIPELQDAFEFQPITDAPTLDEGLRPSRAGNTQKDLAVVIGLAIWLGINLFNWVVRLAMPNWYNTPARYLTTLTGLFFVLVPILFAYSVRTEKYRVPAYIIAGIIALRIIWGNIQSLIHYIN